MKVSASSEYSLWSQSSTLTNTSWPFFTLSIGFQDSLVNQILFSPAAAPWGPSQLGPPATAVNTSQLQIRAQA
jgi:hypothetical protein